MHLQCLADHSAARVGQLRRRGLQRLTLVVDLRAVVEHDQPLRHVPSQHQFDGIGTVEYRIGHGLTNADMSDLGNDVI